MTHLCDAHCHFFSTRFLEVLTKDVPDLPGEGRGRAVVTRLGWEDPGPTDALADRWIAELDRHGVARAALIASIPGDEPSVEAAVRRHPSRFVGFFMFNPAAADAAATLEAVSGSLRDRTLRCIALFPAMHHYGLDDERVQRAFEAAEANGAAVFVHCGFLSVGVRKKLGLASPFDLRRGDPLGVARLAARHGGVPVIIPHFGAGMFRETLMAADACPNVHLDTSSSNAWMRYHPRLTLADVFRQALDVAGPDRLLFGTDSSFFPRGWQRPVYEAQLAALDEAGANADARAKMLGGNFDRLFPL